MRWDELFDDLEAQATALEYAERAAEVDDRVRGEVAALSLHDRARAAMGQSLRLRLLGGLGLVGALVRVGPDWLMLDEGGGREAVVAATALAGIRGLGRYSAVPGSGGIIASRLGLRHVLRGIARDRAGVQVHLVDGSVVAATLDRIGVDFVEVATHAAGEARRRQDVRDVDLIPLAAVAAVRRGG